MELSNVRLANLEKGLRRREAAKGEMVCAAAARRGGHVSAGCKPTDKRRKEWAGKGVPETELWWKWRWSAKRGGRGEKWNGAQSDGNKSAGKVRPEAGAGQGAPRSRRRPRCARPHAAYLCANLLLAVDGAHKAEGAADLHRLCLFRGVAPLQPPRVFIHCTAEVEGRWC